MEGNHFEGSNPYQSLLSMLWMTNEQQCCDLRTAANKTMMDVTTTTWQNYAFPVIEQPKEVTKMKIDPSKFKYDGYFNEYNSPIDDEDARDRMTDYYYRNWDPLIIKEVSSHYYMAGPDAESAPTKRKFYNAVNWYRDFYDGRHGQTTRTEIRRQYDISDPKWQKLVINMVLSGDFDLRQALYTVAIACDRCRNALIFKYCRELGGYPDDSEEYQIRNCRCQFCER